MTIFVKTEKPRIVGRIGKGFTCFGEGTFGIGLSPKESYWHWKTMVQSRPEKSEAARRIAGFDK